MPVRAVFENIRARWHAFCHWLCPTTPEQQLQAEALELANDLARRQRALIQRRCRIERLSGKLRKQAARIAQLTETIAGRFPHTHPATVWPLALRLDRLRQASERTRGKLANQEALYERQRLAFEQRRRTLQEVQRGLLVARMAPAAPPSGTPD